MSSNNFPTLQKALLAAGAFAVGLSPLSAGLAAAQIGTQGTANQPYQGQNYQDQNYQGQPYQGQSYQGQNYQGQPNQGQSYQGQPQGGYDYRNPPPEPGEPQGYDGRTLPPPPQGYVPGAEDRAADARYAADAERWARENCVKSRPNTGAGALVGGVLGAIIGGGLAGRHDTGVGMAAGAAIGAVGGAAVASSSGGQTSPGCPPGYVVRNGAPAYAYAQADYYYAAPAWYRPWVYVDNYWVYRPYPYHGWYYRTYRPMPRYYGGPRGYYGPPRGYYGHGGWGHRRW